MAGVTDLYGDLLRERVEFEELMQNHIARLCEHAGPYVAALVPEDREEFLSAALAAAWREREGFDPTAGSLYQWWEQCLRSAARTRDRWYVFNSHGMRVPVLADNLGRGR